MAKFRKPSMEVLMFGDRDVIATSALSDYHYPQGTPAEPPEIPVGIGATSVHVRSVVPGQDLLGTMQTMMLSNGSGKIKV